MPIFLNSKKRQVITIFSISTLIHIYIIFVSGAWWDDWKFYVNNYRDIRDHYVSAGRLDAYYLISPVSDIPTWMFRLIVLVCFSLSAVIIYLLILMLGETEKTGFMIAFLYNAIPVNDVRVMKCVYPYTIALLLFWVACYLLFGISFEGNMLYCNRIRRIFARACALVLFFISFSMNSLMFFYVVPMLGLWFLLFKKVADNRKFRINLFLKEGLKWMDFYVLPFLFFWIKKKYLNPDPKGVYSNYNVVTIEKCISAIKLVPGAVRCLVNDLVRCCYDIVIKQYNWIIVIFFSVFCGFFLLRKSFVEQDKKTSVSHYLIGLFVGIFLIMAALYPYIVIKQSKIVDITGINGRNAMLVCIGISVCIYYICEVTKIPCWVQHAVIVCVAVVALLHFSYWYVLYAKAYYEQAALQTMWIETREVERGNTFIYVNQSKNLMDLDLERFYSLSALAKNVYGDSSRFFSNGVSDLAYITSYEKKEIMRDDVTNCYDKYDLENIDIDGIMIVSYDISQRDVIKLKFWEIFDYDFYRDRLKNYIDYEYISISREKSHQIYEKYNRGLLTNDDELLQLIK